MDWWLHAKGNTPLMQSKALQSVVLLVAWMVWKYRNSCVFKNAMPSIDMLVDRIKEEEVCFWAKAGAIGLRMVLPPSWDVHCCTVFRTS